MRDLEFIGCWKDQPNEKVVPAARWRLLGDPIGTLLFSGSVKKMLP
jgi:hypothetical protein